MSKSYCDFIDEITSDELYEGLLGYGMITEKLPPVFTSVPFLDYCLNNSPGFSVGWQEYVSFNSMRNLNIPRNFGIPTPMRYEKLCSLLRDNWDVIRTHFHQQTDMEEYRVSRIHLRKRASTKSLFEMNYKNWHVDGNPETDLLMIHSKASRYVVRADISTCFPSIYSHSLPWALVGKETAKQQRTQRNIWYNQLDSACSNMKYGETHGLLIGPHSSNLLAEIILTCVDKRLYESGFRFVRNIDDYECYVESYERAQLFLRDLEDALREYDLSLNHKKTAIKQLPVSINENWIHRLNGSLAEKESYTYTDVNSFLDLALGIADDNGDSAVLKYAIKTLSGLTMTPNAQLVCAQRIMHLAAVYPYLLQLMEEFVLTPYSVDASQVKVFADTVYSEAMAVNNYEAISYAIYFALKYGFELASLDIDWVIDHKDCILLLMTWLYYSNYNLGNNKATQLDKIVNYAKSLIPNEMDRYWIFCYEVLPVSDLSGEWQQLKQEGISFIKTV